jgi:hypothetical protein
MRKSGCFVTAIQNRINNCRIWPVGYGEPETGNFVAALNWITRSVDTKGRWPSKIYAETRPHSAAGVELMPQPNRNGLDGTSEAVHLHPQNMNTCYATVINGFNLQHITASVPAYAYQVYEAVFAWGGYPLSAEFVTSLKCSSQAASDAAGLQRLMDSTRHNEIRRYTPADLYSRMRSRALRAGDEELGALASDD